jgi:hypothetical protein
MIERDEMVVSEYFGMLTLREEAEMWLNEVEVAVMVMPFVLPLGAILNEVNVVVAEPVELVWEYTELEVYVVVVEYMVGCLLTSQMLIVATNTVQFEHQLLKGHPELSECHRTYHSCRVFP